MSSQEVGVGTSDPLLDFGAHPNLDSWLAYLREHAPVHLSGDGTYVISRYEDVANGLHDWETYSSHLPLAESDVEGANERLMVYRDGDDHWAVRRLVAKGMTSRAIAEVVPDLRTEIDARVASIDPDVEVDVVGIARTMARNSLAIVFGLERDDFGRIDGWLSSTLVNARPEIMAADYDKLIGRLLPKTRQERQAFFDAGRDDLEAYLRSRIGEFEDVGLDDVHPPFVQAVVASVREDPANLQRIVGTVMPPLLSGGIHTTSNGLINLMHYVAEHPQVLADVQNGTVAAPVAIEEILRVNGLIQGMPRITTRDVDVRGVHIPKGSIVRLMYFSTSHDSEAFDHPDDFAPEGSSRHFAFGFGRHHCIGASLARQELELLLNALVRRFSHFDVMPGSQEYGGLGVYQTLTKFVVVPRARR